VSNSLRREAQGSDTGGGGPEDRRRLSGLQIQAGDIWVESPDLDIYVERFF
jgi:hypothetical protein